MEDKLRQSSAKWPWWVLMLMLIIILDLCAVTWYFWAMPGEEFGHIERIIPTVVSWLVTFLTFFGIRFGFKKVQTIDQVFTMRPVQVSIVVLTVLIWYFILPFHSITFAVQDSVSGLPLSGVVVTVDDDKAPRLMGSNETGNIKIEGLLTARHNFNMELDGYVSLERTSSFMDVLGLQKVIEIALERSRGGVMLKTNPEGAEIYLDDNDSIAIGTTPKTLSRLTGKHKIMFKKSGYDSTIWEEISIFSDSTTLLERNLTETLLPIHELTIFTNFYGAEIYIDGKLESTMKSTTKFTIRLTAGKHEIEARLSGFDTIKETILLPAESLKFYNFIN